VGSFAGNLAAVLVLAAIFVLVLVLSLVLVLILILILVVHGYTSKIVLRSDPLE